MHWFTDVITNKYFEFDGRASKQEFWMFVLFYFIFAIGISIIAEVSGAKLLADLFALALLIPSIGVTVRRLHDIGKSGWWVFIGLIPLLGLIVLIVFTIQDGQPGENDYGPNPKETGDDNHHPTNTEAAPAQPAETQPQSETPPTPPSEQSR